MADTGERSRANATSKSTTPARTRVADADLEAGLADSLSQQTMRTLGNAGMQALLGVRRPPPRNAELSVGIAGSAIEREADRIAEEAMRAPGVAAMGANPRSMRMPPTHRSPPGGSTSMQVSMQAQHEASRNPGARRAPPIVHRALSAAGRPLDTPIRREMASRFGVDFGGVRIHTDALSAASARAIGARAYTYGQDIVFGAGMYRPETLQGKTLLAHELAHVLQMSVPGAEPQICRQEGWPGGVPTLDDVAVGHSSSDCPCEPFPTQEEARRDRDARWPSMRARIALVVDEAVLSIYDDYVYGRAMSPRDLSSQFGEDFAASETTTDAAHYLSIELMNDLSRNPMSLAYGQRVLEGVRMTDRLSVQIGNLQNSVSQHHMNFSRIAGAPGMLAGNVGPTDFRSADVVARVERIDANRIRVQPTITFTIRDTVDLCPGDCGVASERGITVPMSRWEASGITSDVEFSVTYSVPGEAFTVAYTALPMGRERLISEVVQRYLYIRDQSRRPEYNLEELTALSREIRRFARELVETIAREQHLTRAEAEARLRAELEGDSRLGVGGVRDIFSLAGFSFPISQREAAGPPQAAE